MPTNLSRRNNEREQEWPSWGHRWNHVSLSTTKSNIVHVVQIQKQQVVSGFGFRLPVQLFTFIHDFRDREKERKGEENEKKGEGDIRTNLHYSWATRPFEFLAWSTFETLTGCTPCGNAFTIELTIGSQHSSAVDIATKHVRGIDIWALSSNSFVFRGQLKGWN